MGNLLDLSAHLVRAAIAIDGAVVRESFEKAGMLLEMEIKSAIGTFRYGWAALAESTVARKGSAEPLLEFGVFRESITHVVGYHEAWIGTNDFRAWWFEMGTSKMPPRPFMSPALELRAHDVVACFSQPVMAAIVGRA